MYAPESRKSTTSPLRRSSFARDMARDAFGKLGHLHDGEWADHHDIHPGELTEKRIRAIWGVRRWH